MPTEHKTVFISYRRNVASFIARAIFLDLRAHHYDVFMDVESIDSGQFEQIIFNQVEARAHFLVILTPGTADRFANPDDMMRREIEYAMEKQRNIVPLLANNFSFTDAQPYLTGKLEQLPSFNGLTIPHEYFDEAMARLRKRYLKLPVTGIVKPAPVADQPAVERKIEEIAAQPVPTVEQLSAEDYFNRGLQKKESDDLDGAIADYTEAIRLNPQYSYAYNNRGNARQSKGDLDGAIADHTRSIELKNPELHVPYNNRGVARVDKGDFDAALADYTEAIRLNPNFAEAYNNRGNVRKTKGDVDAAIGDLTEALRLDPNYAVAWNNRGNARVTKGDFDGAIADYTEAIRLNPNYTDAWNNRGSARAGKGDCDGAIADYDEAIRLNPQYTHAYSNRGIARRSKGDPASAIADYDEAIRLNPQYADAYNNRGIARYDKGDLDGAIADYDEAIRINPNAIRYNNRGEAYFAKSQFNIALEDFQQANRLQPADNMTLGGLAITQYALGNKAEAKRLWRTLLAQDQRYRDADWVGKEFNWHPTLVEAARKLIAEL